MRRVSKHSQRQPAMKVITATSLRNCMDGWIISTSINLLMRCCCGGFDVSPLFQLFLFLKGWLNGGRTRAGLGSPSGWAWRLRLLLSRPVLLCRHSYPSFLIHLCSVFTGLKSHAALRPPRSTLFWGQLGGQQLDIWETLLQRWICMSRSFHFLVNSCRGREHERNICHF